MADLLTSGQKAKQRADGHKSKFYLSVVRPAILLTCTVNSAALERGAISIPFDAGTGTPALILGGMTVRIVNSYGEFTTRLVSLASSGSSPAITGTLTVDPNNIIWPDDAVVVIEEMHDPTTIPPEFDPLTGISKKRSTVFSGQTTQPGPLLRMGGHKAKFMGEDSSSGRVAASLDDGNITSGLTTQYVTTGPAVTIGTLAGVTFGDWFRLAELPIPPGAIILTAGLTLTAAADDSGDVDVTIDAELALDPAAPASRADYLARAHTTESVNWVFSTAWTTAEARTTPDLTAIFQEIIDQPGWAAGNACQIFINDNGSAGRRRVMAFDGDPDQAVLFEITWVEPVTFDLDAVGVPVAPGASIVSYLWLCADGVIADANAQNTTISFSTFGGRWVYCFATDSNGKSQSAVRHYWVHSRDPESTDYPYTEFQTAQIPTTFEGGSNVSLNVSGVSDFTAFRDGTLLMIWREAWFGDEAGPISLIAGQENVSFLGYIARDTISFDSEHGTVGFEALSPVSVMRNLPMQALSIHAEQTITYWFQTDRRMTLIMMIQWLLYWHSNLLALFEWTIPTGGLFKKLFKFNEGSLFAQVQDICSKYAAQLGCDKAGNVYVEPHANLLDQAGRDALDTLMEITRADWRERLVITRRHKRVTPLVSGKGFFYDGANVLLPYCSIAPTKIRETSGQGGKNLDGMVVADQDHLNRLTGQQLALDNREIEEVRVSFAGDYSVIDVFPQRWVRMSLAAGDTPRGISFTDMRFVARSVSQVLHPAAGHLDVEVVFEPEVNGPAGTFDPCPSQGTAPSTSPLASRTGEPAVPTPAASALASFSSLRYLPAGATAWVEYDADFVALDGSLDPFWRIKQKSSNLSRAIYWAVGAGCTVRQIVGTAEKTDRNIATSPPNDWSDGAPPLSSNTDLVQIRSSIFASGRHYVAGSHYTGALWRGWVGKTTDDFVTFAWHTLFEMGDVQTKLLYIAEDMQDGSVLWLTCWRDGELWLEKWSASTMTRDAAVDLGAATEADVNTRSLWAGVAAAPGDKDLVYVFGRMTDPAGLSGTYHIIVSDDGGSTFGSFVDDWDADHCSQLEISLEEGGQRTYWALRAPQVVEV